VKTKYNIIEIFDSIEGEGKRAGAPATFIRLAGCNLRCAYCDTTYAMEGNYQTRDIDDILLQVKKGGFSRVTLTGGEPLTAPSVEVLIHQLLTCGNEVNIETNGSIDVKYVLEYLESKVHDPARKLFFTMDYKLPSSGVTGNMLLSNFSVLRPWDVLKFVVGSQSDIEHMVDFLHSLTSQPQIYIGAVYEKYDYKKLVSAILKTPELKDAKLQLQLHKIIWDPNERGV